MSKKAQYLSIDEEGQIWSGDAAINDAEKANELLENLYFAENGAYATRLSEDAEALIYIEAFDDPLVAQDLEAGLSETWGLQCKYGFVARFNLNSLCVDEWDRFHGLTDKGIPFVLSKKAQAQFFDLVTEFDDDSFTFANKNYVLQPLLSAQDPVEKPSYWGQRYQEQTTAWDLGQAAPAFIDMLPRLKIPRSRVLVLGCGAGHDAALFAQQGHLVTAVDFAAEALIKAKSLYGRFDNITFLQANALDLPKELHGQFDIVVEHTCFCAIDPDRRNDLVKSWRLALQPRGFLLAVFFTMYRRHQAPFGASEWELRSRLKKSMHFLFWGRWRQSIQGREGKELLVYAQRQAL